MADIVVYGGSFAAAAAAAKAAANAPNKTVAVIIPDPVSSTGSSFGSIGTVGGQNCFDVRNWNGDNPVKGTFSWWISRWGQFYGVDQMANQLKNDVIKYSNLTVYYGYDIKSFASAGNPYRITQVTICSVSRNSAGIIAWGGTTQIITGTVFIDASDDGRLARIANFGGTVGRYDWPAACLDAEERGNSGRARQQVATRMFKVKGVQYGAPGDMVWGNPSGVEYCYGGLTAYRTDPVLVAFNNTYGPQGVRPQAHERGAGRGGVHRVVDQLAPGIQCGRAGLQP